MGAQHRTPGQNWDVATKDGKCLHLQNYGHIHAELLFDIRDELRTLNNVFRCHNALAIPTLLRDIRQHAYATREALAAIQQNTKPKPAKRKKRAVKK
jgi:hypothetical protein